MPLDLSNFSAVTQQKLAALTASDDPKTLLLLAKAIEAAIGNMTVTDVIATGTAQIAAVAAEGSTQVQSVQGAADATQTAAEAFIVQVRDAAEVSITQTKADAEAAVTAVRDEAVATLIAAAPAIADLSRNVEQLRLDPLAPIIVSGPITRRVLRETQSAVSGDLEVTGDYWVQGTHVVLDVPSDGSIVLADMVEDDLELTEGALVASNGTLAIAPWATLTLGSNAAVVATDLGRTFVV